LFWPASGGRSTFLNKKHMVINMVSRITEQKGMNLVAPFVRRVGDMVRTSQFKRRLPVIAKISHRTIDRDFRYARDWGR